MLSGFIANVLMVVAILKNKSLRTPMNMDLVSLACADAIVCVLVIPIRLLLYNTNGDYLALCKGAVCLKTLCDSVQPCMLVATSFERYKSIAKPFDTIGKKRRTLIIVISVWIICGLLAILCTVSFSDGSTFYPCYVSGDMKRKAIDSLLFEPRYFREGIITLPIGIVCIVNVILFYGLMMRVLREHTAKMGKKKTLFKNTVAPIPPVAVSILGLKTGDIPNENKQVESTSKVILTHQENCTETVKKETIPIARIGTSALIKENNENDVIHTDTKLLAPNAGPAFIDTGSRKMSIKPTRMNIRYIENRDNCKDDRGSCFNHKLGENGESLNTRLSLHNACSMPVCVDQNDLTSQVFRPNKFSCSENSKTVQQAFCISNPVTQQTDIPYPPFADKSYSVDSRTVIKSLDCRSKRDKQSEIIRKTDTVDCSTNTGHDSDKLEIITDAKTQHTVPGYIYKLDDDSYVALQTDGILEHDYEYNAIGICRDIHGVRSITSDTTNKPNETFSMDTPIKLGLICEENMAGNEEQYANSDCNKKSKGAVNDPALVKQNSLTHDC
ncbi:hypothetical protein DPMN_160218 [Dreissena polymorpha]|uniref:G-protein coupled receptors family 1 profile domain-containing protein n=1 Tax=Dreissena polymorpha TaxID=45954 RepID=A0A9D4EKD8_DREPO|nr:hypothetical protein DPMN_160218 [Dreissena polymorpha]